MGTGTSSLYPGSRHPWLTPYNQQIWSRDHRSGAATGNPYRQPSESSPWTLGLVDTPTPAVRPPGTSDTNTVPPSTGLTAPCYSGISPGLKHRRDCRAGSRHRRALGTPGTHRCGRSRQRPAALAAPRRSAASHRRRPAAAPLSPSRGRQASAPGQRHLPPPPLPGGAAGPGSAHPCGPGLPRTGHCQCLGSGEGCTESGVHVAPEWGGRQLPSGLALGHSTSTWSCPQAP